jgi:hypothetical protein
MKVNKWLVIVLFCLIMPLSVMAADDYSCGDYYNGKCHYNSNKAVEYANKMINNKKTWNIYFPSYRGYGGDCTNFVSQCILAGLVGSSSPRDLYKKSGNFHADLSGCNYCWYFKRPRKLSYAWKGAHELYTYAIENRPEYKGLHFQFITKDSPRTSLSFRKIRKGDIIFADWEGDSEIDHTMIVTNKTRNWYNGVRVTYENGGEYSTRKNIRLIDINNRKTVFHVYRPIYYTDFGY